MTKFQIVVAILGGAIIGGLGGVAVFYVGGGLSALLVVLAFTVFSVALTLWISRKSPPPTAEPLPAAQVKMDTGKQWREHQPGPASTQG
jgi:hypothetical protein